MAAVAAKTAEEEENAKRKAARKRRNERVESDLPRTSMTAVMIAATTRREGVPLVARKLKCTLKKMKRIWRMNERGKKFYNITIRPSNETPTICLLYCPLLKMGPSWIYSTPMAGCHLWPTERVNIPQ